MLERLTTELIVETGRIVARDLDRAFRHRASAPRGRRPQPACRRGRRASARRTQRSWRRRWSGCRPRASMRAGRCRPTRCFTRRARATYDVALCMYHDQALIPIKTLAFDHAVNVTLGLPFVRTSPDHGTAFDIAGTGKADPSSLVAALTLAARLAAGGDRSAAADARKVAHGADRRPAAAARGHPPARTCRQKIARPEFPARSQSDRAHRARRRTARRRDRGRNRPRAGRADARAAGRRRRAA